MSTQTSAAAGAICKHSQVIITEQFTIKHVPSVTMNLTVPQGHCPHRLRKMIKQLEDIGCLAVNRQSCFPGPCDGWCPKSYDCPVRNRQDECDCSLLDDTNSRRYAFYKVFSIAIKLSIKFNEYKTGLTQLLTVNESWFPFLDSSTI